MPVAGGNGMGNIQRGVWKCFWGTRYPKSIFGLYWLLVSWNLRGLNFTAFQGHVVAVFTFSSFPKRWWTMVIYRFTTVKSTKSPRQTNLLGFRRKFLLENSSDFWGFCGDCWLVELKGFTAPPSQCSCTWVCFCLVILWGFDPMEFITIFHQHLGEYVSNFSSRILCTSKQGSVVVALGYNRYSNSWPVHIMMSFHELSLGWVFSYGKMMSKGSQQGWAPSR